MIDHPRLLFVTPHTFNHTSGGGIAFTNLFRGWPADRLATAHNDEESVTDDVCRNYYALDPAEIDLADPFAMARRWFRRQGVKPRAAAPRPAVKEAIKQFGVGLLGDTLPERATLTPRLEHWIADFKPEILYTILGSNGMMELVEKILDRFDLPLVVHIMDDWPAASHRRGLLAWRERRIMERRLARLFARAAECLAISPAMATAYGGRYGRKFHDFQNTVDVARWAPVAKAARAAGRPAELLYIGSIFPNAQLESLVDSARTVAALNREGFPVRLSIAMRPLHAERYRARLAIDPAIRLEAVIGDDTAFYARLDAADALLVPVNFDADSIRFIRYSMPAKLPAYLVSGTPILVYGPSAAAQVDYALREQWAHVVGNRSDESLGAGIRTIMNDTNLRQHLRAAALRTALRHHDAVAVRGEFQAVLARAAHVQKPRYPA